MTTFYGFVAGFAACGAMNAAIVGQRRSVVLNLAATLLMLAFIGRSA